MPIDENLLNNPENRYIEMHSDQHLGAALVALVHLGGESWWHLVIKLGEGQFAAAPFRKLTPGEGISEVSLGDYFHQPLVNLIGEQVPEVLVAEQAAIGTETAKDMAYDSPGRVMVVTREGRCIGILYMGEAGGIFEDAPLLNLFGRYREINPEEYALWDEETSHGKGLAPAEKSGTAQIDENPIDEDVTFSEDKLEQA